jgi:hypothetical protein
MVWVRFAALPLCALDRQMSIREMWADERFRTAVTFASPVLADDVRRSLDAGNDDAADLYRSLRSYYVRMASRPTPFATMSGSFTGRLDDVATTISARLRLDPRLRPAPLLPGPALADDAVLQVNPGLGRFGTHYLVPPRGALRSASGQLTTVPATPTVDRVAAMLATAATVGDTAARLAELSGSEPASWRRYLAHLHGLGVVIRQVVADPAVVETPSSNEPATDVAPSRQFMDAFATDADAAPVPAALGRHALEICDSLDRLNPAPGYPPQLQAIAEDFEHRFGPGVEVPLIDTFDPIGGIELRPAGQATPRRSDANRESVLRELLDDHRDELLISLSERLIAELASDARPVVPRAPVQQFLLRPVQGPDGLLSELRFAGAETAFGDRLLHLLPPASRALAIQQADRYARAFEPFEAAELIADPRYARDIRLAGLVPVESAHRRWVSLAPGTAGTADLLAAEDLLVGLDPGSRRLYLRSRRSERLLHVHHASMVVDSCLAPLEAFVLQVSRAQHRYSTAFAWGGLGTQDFLPGLRVGATLISSPRWLLHGSAADRPREWFASRAIPDRYVARSTGSDRSLLLLRGQDDEILLRLLRKSGSGTVEIQLSPDAFGRPLLTDGAGAAHVADVAVTAYPVTEPTTPPVPLPVVDRRAADRLNREWAAFDIVVPAPMTRAFLSDLAGWLDGNDSLPGSELVWWTVGEASVRVNIPLSEQAQSSLLAEFQQWAGRRCRRGELRGVTQLRSHFQLGLVATVAEPAWYRFMALDSRRTVELARSAPPASARYQLAVAIHLLRLAVWSGTAELPGILRDREGTGSGQLYRSIGAELHAALDRDRPDSKLDERWRLAAGELLAKAPPGTVLALLQLSLDRCCVPAAWRPQLRGAVRRTLDRLAHERRHPA